MLNKPKMLATNLEVFDKIVKDKVPQQHMYVSIPLSEPEDMLMESQPIDNNTINAPFMSSQPIRQSFINPKQLTNVTTMQHSGNSGQSNINTA